MKKIEVLAALALFSVFLIAIAPASSAAQTPTLSPPPVTLPSVTYYINGTENHYTLSNPQWQLLFSDVINNKSMVSYNWSQNLTEDLIVFDLSYTGLNPYGMTLISQLSFIGSPTVQNFSKAFNNTKNDPSLVKSGGSTLSNIQALNAGAYPGFNWSQIKVNPVSTDYRDAGIIGAIIAATFVLYFYFNRKR
ncbi:MAG: hypothetical protein M1129_03405 [Candidatus Thermoplasmatota archaeon]|jgi:hypothetical protein|nr:hypothetical protein [Candidatus Thermoplasmatota archaeon]MCL5954915.1 hypothetical protein [Candidatus Thermoplasmatota archaeon]